MLAADSVTDVLALLKPPCGALTLTPAGKSETSVRRLVKVASGIETLRQKRVQWTRPSGSFFGKLRGEAPKRRVGDMFPAFTTLMEVWIHGYF